MCGARSRRIDLKKQTRIGGGKKTGKDKTRSTHMNNLRECCYKDRWTGSTQIVRHSINSFSRLKVNRLHPETLLCYFYYPWPADILNTKTALRNSRTGKRENLRILYAKCTHDARSLRSYSIRGACLGQLETRLGFGKNPWVHRERTRSCNFPRGPLRYTYILFPMFFRPKPGGAGTRARDIFTVYGLGYDIPIPSW